MGTFKYPHLFEPIKLGGTLFRNRIFAAPTGYRNMTTDSVYPHEATCYFGRKAMGGAASVSTGEIVVDSELGKGSPYHMCIDNPNSWIPLGKVANAISRYGAVPTAELQHAACTQTATWRSSVGRQRASLTVRWNTNLLAGLSRRCRKR